MTLRFRAMVALQSFAIPPLSLWFAPCPAPKRIDLILLNQLFLGEP